MSNIGTINYAGAAQEIHRDEWIPFLAAFTRENRGAHARIEIVGPDTEVGYQVETENRPFDGIAADIKDRERAVWITFGSSPNDHLTHGVQNAVLIRMLPRTSSRGPVLEVEAAGGTKTILELTRVEDYALPPAGPRAASK